MSSTKAQSEESTPRYSSSASPEMEPPPTYSEVMSSSARSVAASRSADRATTEKGSLTVSDLGVVDEDDPAAVPAGVAQQKPSPADSSSSPRVDEHQPIVSQPKSRSVAHAKTNVARESERRRDDEDEECNCSCCCGHDCATCCLHCDDVCRGLLILVECVVVLMQCPALCIEACCK